MKKLLIADDEPLALVGVRSMLAWEDYGIEVCATAHNGEQAIRCIEQHRPDIVITDIKMPIKTGLDVLEESNRRFGSLPVFIMLTSYEDFSFAKEALHYGAIEYLVKLEITQESLAEAVTRAAAHVDELRGKQSAAVDSERRDSLQTYRDTFFAHLYFTTFESREQFSIQCHNLGFRFSDGTYAVAAFEILPGETAVPTERELTLYTSAMQMVQDTVDKFMTCYVTSLDIRHFNILLQLTELPDDQPSRLMEILKTAVTMVRNYCNVQLLCAVGVPVSDVFLARKSYCSAQTVMSRLTAEQSVAMDDGVEPNDSEAANNFTVVRSGLERAFGELDASALHDMMTQIAADFEEHPTNYVQAMNVAVSLQHMAISLLPDGEATLERIFADQPDNYRSLYLQTTAEQCRQWILRLRDGLCESLHARKQSYKKRLVKEVQKYIVENLDKCLSITEVAGVFHFSPNYLSRLFAQYSDCGYVDYVTQEKISAAKAMMSSGDKKVYEIAELLGYSSAFYFSKVFKKTTGKTPREYMQSE